MPTPIGLPAFAANRCREEGLAYLNPRVPFTDRLQRLDVGERYNPVAVLKTTPWHKEHSFAIIDGKVTVGELKGDGAVDFTRQDR